MEDRWTLEGWDELRGLPWDVNLSSARPEPERTREFYVRRTDVNNYGPMPGCKTCRRISEKLPVQGTHSEECRNRMKSRVQGIEQERFSKYEETRF